MEENKNVSFIKLLIMVDIDQNMGRFNFVSYLQPRLWIEMLLWQQHQDCWLVDRCWWPWSSQQHPVSREYLVLEHPVSPLTVSFSLAHKSGLATTKTKQYHSSSVQQLWITTETQSCLFSSATLASLTFTAQTDFCYHFLVSFATIGVF